MARRKPPRRDITAQSSNAEMMRTLDMGGARSNYGFGRRPEGVLSHGFETARHMVFGRAKPKRYIPLKGDRVRESGPGGLVGHVESIRHINSGLEAKVFADGSSTGHWISSSKLRRI